METWKPGKVNVSTDVAVVIDATKIVLIKRRNEPFKDKLCLPGGFFEPEVDQNLLESCAREASEEINLQVPIGRFKLLVVLSGKGRDPRPWGPRVSAVYHVDISEEEAKNLQAGETMRKRLF